MITPRCPLIFITLSRSIKKLLPTGSRSAAFVRIRARREVRAASLLAVLLTLPIAFLALVPSGAVAPPLYDVIRVVSGALPFKPTLQALDCALNRSEPGVGVSVLHLLGLTAGFGVIARLAMRRLA